MKKYYLLILLLVGFHANAQTGSSTEVGVTKGELSVSLTGAAIYQVPIDVPPGIGNVKPEISLNYYSQGGNAEAGYSWSIGGLSKITRTSSTSFHDGSIDAVDFDNSDRFSFDGQRLMLRSGTGTYGADQSQYDTEIVNNVKITAVGVSPYGATYGPSYFYVQYPDGSIAYYGLTTDSRSRKEWAISYWQNPLGARITYNYTTSNNNIYISSVKYGTKFTTTPINEIQFVYKTRQRTEQEYIGGISFMTNIILSEIKVLGNGTGYRNYLLGHDLTSLGYQRLTSITEKSGDGTKSYNPTVFNYQNTTDAINYEPLITTTTSGPPNPAISNSNVITSEFNGDGHMDFLLYATSGQFNKNTYWFYYDLDSPTGPSMTSHNVGAFEEIFPVKFLNHFTEMLPYEGWTVIQKGTPVGTVNFNIYAYAPSSIIIPQYSRTYQFPTAVGSTEIPKQYVSGDFNGDRLTDILAINKSEVVQGVNYGGGTFFVNLDRRITTNFVSNTGSITITANSVIRVGDYNADGKSDIFVFDTGIVRVYTLGSNNLMTLLVSFADAQIITSTTILMGDYNGDGKRDFIIPKASGETEFRKFLSTGTTFVKTVETYTGLVYATQNVLNIWHWMTNDYNNDGKSDLVVVLCSRNQSDSQGQVSVTCYMNKGGAFSRTTGNYVSTTTGMDSQFDMFGIPLFMSADKANPKLEIACIRNNKIYYFQSQKDFGKEQLLSSIANGNGVTNNIAYSHLGKCSTPGCVSTYSLDATSVYPEYNLNEISDFYIVSQLEQNSSTNYKKQIYRYLNAVTNAEGQGFQGFKKIFKTNWHQTNEQLTSTISTFDLAKHGVLTEEVTVQSWGALATWATYPTYLSKAIYNYEEEEVGNKIYRSSKVYQAVYNGVEGTSKETSFDYGAYNNPTASYTHTKSGTTLQKTENVLIEYDNVLPGPFYFVGRPAKKNTETTVDGNIMKTEEIYTYNATLQATQIKKKGHETEYITEDNIYDSFGNVTKKTISAPGLAARETNFEYDASGRFLTKSTDMENLSTLYANNPSTGWVTSKTDPYGRATQFFYDVWGKTIKVTDYLGKNTTIAYSNTAGPRSQALTTGDEGSSSIKVHDDLQREIITGQKNVDDTWSYVMNIYDIYDRKSLISEPYASLTGVPTQFNTTLYDINGRITQTTSATGETTTITYSGLSSTANDGTKTITTVKNATGNIVSMTDNGGTITYLYYPNDNLKQSKFGAYITSIEQDGWGRKTKIADLSAGNFLYEYNHFGEITKETNPKGVTTYTLDDKGKTTLKTVVGDNTNTKTTYTYDPTTKFLTYKKFEDITDGFYNEYTYEYDASNRLWRTGENTFKVYFQQAILFDEFGRPSSIYNSAIHSATGKRSDNWTTRTYKNGLAWQLTDTDSGQLIWRTNTVNSRGQLTGGVFGNDIAITNTYDDFGFPTQFKHDKTTSPQANIMTLASTYNAPKGNLTTRSNSMFGWNESFQYDNLDRLTHYTNARGEQEQQVYDTRGRITQNNLGSYSYGTVSKPYSLTAINLVGEGTSYYNNREGIFSDGMEDKKGWTIYYDPTAITYDTTKSHTGSYSIKIDNNTATEKMVFSEVYTRIDNTVATEYTYSAWVYSEGPQTELFLYMKTSLATSTFTVDNIQTNATGYWKYVEKTFLVPANIKYLMLRLDNNQTGKAWFDDVRIRKTSDATAVRKLNVSYNVANNPVQIEETGIDKISFTYHDSGARYSMFYGSTATDKAARPLEKHYSSDGVIEVKYNKVTGTVEFTTFVGGNAYDAPAISRKTSTRLESPAQYLYLHRDSQGSIMAITNQSGTVVEKRLYDAWGTILKIQDGNGNNLAGLTALDRGYTGHEHLQSVDLIHMNGRIYDSKVRRFLQPDNFVQDAFNTQSHNRYGYALNNPLKYTDPSGEILGSIITAIWEGLGNVIKHGINFDNYDWDKLQNAWKIDVGLLKLDSNRTFFGQVLQLVSRYTWELPQTSLGYAYSHARNLGGEVDEVMYFGGATFAINENARGNRKGISLGNFININIKNDLKKNDPRGFMFTEEGLFWHEYGHTFQSMRFGLSYLFVIGIPSLTGLFNQSEWTETSANRWAWRYADKFNYMAEWEYPGREERPLHTN